MASYVSKQRWSTVSSHTSKNNAWSHWSMLKLITNKLYFKQNLTFLNRKLSYVLHTKSYCYKKQIFYRNGKTRAARKFCKQLNLIVFAAKYGDGATLYKKCMLSAAYNYLPKKKKHVERKQSIVILHHRWALLVLGDSAAKSPGLQETAAGKNYTILIHRRPHNKRVQRKTLKGFL